MSNSDASIIFSTLPARKKNVVEETGQNILCQPESYRDTFPELLSRLEQHVRYGYCTGNSKSEDE